MYQFPKNWYLYSVEYSMNSTDLSSYLNLLWVLSLELCSFHNTSPEHVSLELCLIILFCWVIISGVLFLTVVSTCSFLVYRNTTDFFVSFGCIICGLWDLSSLTKDWILNPGPQCEVLITRLPGCSLNSLIPTFFLSGFLGIFFIDKDCLCDPCVYVIWKEAQFYFFFSLMNAFYFLTLLHWLELLF